MLRLTAMCALLIGCGGSTSHTGDPDGGGSGSGSGTDGGTVLPTDLFDGQTATIAVDHAAGLAIVDHAVVVAVAQQVAGDPTIIVETEATGRTFTPTPYVAGTTSRTLAFADLDADGTPDLLAGSLGKPSVDVMPGATSNTFTTPALTSQLGAYTDHFAVAHFDAGATLDLVVGPKSGDTKSIVFVPGNGDGTFGTPVPMAVGFRLDDIVAADLNGDGKGDVVVASFLDGNVLPLLGNGDGTFTAQPGLTFDNTSDVQIGDVNGDGKLDLVILTPGRINVALGAGDGTFTLADSFRAKTADLQLVLADLDGDGKLDAIAQDGISDAIEVLLGNGDGTFSANIQVPFVNVAAMALGDVDGDGHLDLALLGQSTPGVTVMFGKPHS